MKKCNFLRFDSDESGYIHVEALGTDEHANFRTRRLPLGNSALPLETLEVALLDAMLVLFCDEWTFMEPDYQVENTLYRLARFVDRDRLSPGGQIEKTESDLERHKIMFMLSGPVLTKGEYIFFVETPVDKARFDRAGVHAAVYNSRKLPTERFVIIVSDDVQNRGKAIAELLKRYVLYADALRSWMFLCEPDDPCEWRLRSRARMVMKMARESFNFMKFGAGCPF